MEKPTFKQRVDAFTNFLWDSNTGKVLGRGGKSWAEISLFYIVYYACLAAFFSATLVVFYETVPSDQPKLLKDSSLLDGNPGMGFRPMTDIDDHKVTIKGGGLGKNKDAVENLKAFLKPYGEATGTENCDAIKSTRPKAAVPCEVNMDELKKQCTEANDFGYENQKPCILIKLNKVYGWEPELWGVGDPKIPSAVAKGYDSSIIPIKCTTKDSSDESKLGDVLYYPHQGFPVAYYPFLKQKDYLPPLVFVQFPNITKKTGFEIECRVYAKNIEYDRTEVQGSVQFKLNME